MPIGASRQGVIKNVIRHHKGCRLVHPTKWDILTMPYTNMTNADWCIPPCWSFGISIQFKMSIIDQFVYNLINHSHAINCQTFQISHIQIHTFVISFQGYTHSIYSFQVYLVITKHLKYEYNFDEKRTNNT